MRASSSPLTSSASPPMAMPSLPRMVFPVDALAAISAMASAARSGALSPGHPFVSLTLAPMVAV